MKECLYCDSTSHPSEHCAKKPDRVGQGARYNEGKPLVNLIPPNVILELAKHYMYGASKYQPNDWLKGFPYSQTYDSLQRHLLAWWGGEKLDPESGHHHLTAVVWNAVTLLYFELLPWKYEKFDDRPWPTTDKYVVDKMLQMSVDWVDSTTATPVADVLAVMKDTIQSPVPIPEGYRLLGPYAHIKVNDRVWSKGKWVETQSMGDDRPIGLYGYESKFPVTRLHHSSQQILCPLCSQPIDDNWNWKHESDCPFKDVVKDDIKLPNELIEVGDRLFDKGEYVIITKNKIVLGQYVAGRAILRSSENLVSSRVYIPTPENKKLLDKAIKNMCGPSIEQESIDNLIQVIYRAVTEQEKFI